MLPVIITTAEREMLLRPDDLRAQLEPTSRQTDGGDVAEQSRVPDISDIAGKQCISLLPVDAIVVEHLASCEPVGIAAAVRSPGRIVVDPIGR